MILYLLDDDEKNELYSYNETHNDECKKMKKITRRQEKKTMLLKKIETVKWETEKVFKCSRLGRERERAFAIIKKVTAFVYCFKREKTFLLM